MAPDTLTTQLCSPDEQAISKKVNAQIHCLTRNESIALAFVSQSGALSLAACVITFALILRNIRHHARKYPGQWRLIKVPMDVYLLSLFVAETFLSFGGFMNGKWVMEGKVQVGTACSFQGVGLSMGTINVACSTLAIAVHTFVMVWCNRGFNAIRVAWIVMSIPWLFSIIYVASIGAVHRHEPDTIFRPSPYWCWIGRNYLVHRLFGAYFWMWSSLFISVILYIPLFFWGRGNITIGERFWSFRIHRRQLVDDHDGQRRHSLTMIAYPLVYAAQILPLSAARWIGFVQENHGDKKNHVPPTALIAVQVLHLMSGLANVLLFVYTRPNLLLFKDDGDSDRSENMAPLYGGGGDADSIEGRKRYY